MAAPEKLKPGTKRCPKCGTVNAARSSVCASKKCGHVFSKKMTGAAGKKDPFAILRAVGDYVKECGGIDSARTELNTIEQLLKATGGIANARAALDQLEMIKKM